MAPAGFTVARRSLSSRLAALLVQLFRGFASWNDDDVADFVDQAVPLAEGARRTMADLTAAWIAEQATTHTGIVVPATSVPDEVLARPNITSAEVYTRPFITVRAQLSRGRDVPQAVDVAAHRLETIAEGDMQRAHTQAAAVAIEDLPAEAKPIGWRRVLQGPTNCPMCVVASTQLYGSGELSASHPRCDCTVELAYTDPHPADEGMARAALAELGVDPDSADTRALLKVMTGMHGELGPMLIRPGQHFDGPADIPS